MISKLRHSVLALLFLVASVFAVVVIASENLISTTLSTNQPIDNADSEEPQFNTSENAEDVTKYPILIPQDIEYVTQYGDTLIPIYDEEYQSEDVSNDPFNPTLARGRIASSDHFNLSCGDNLEKCPIEQSNKLIAGEDDKARPDGIDYMKSPNYCRCDKGTCDHYGDCCWTIAVTLLHENPWKCHRLQSEKIWALMISKCPNASSPAKTACETPEKLEHYTHTHDIPVYSNVTRKMYRNTHCARCNGVNSKQIFPMKILVRCSKNFTQQERKNFVANAEYQRGQRLWKDKSSNATCGIYIPQLADRYVQRYFSDLRFCRKDAIEECPPSALKENPTAAALCRSYTQYVSTKNGFIFKNPHCAECFGFKDPLWDFRCLEEPKLIFGPGRITPGNAGTSLESSGLQLIFDFDLGSGGNYVGYEAKCLGDTVWNFLKQKCAPIICGKNHYMDKLDGKCKPDPTLELPGNNTWGNGSDNHPLNSTHCYFLIVHDTEFTLLENQSIVVNKSGTNESVLFRPEDYVQWNESSIGICARDLASSFTSRFPPLLNYLSSAALGCSIFFSFLHLLIFIALPQMRNLPGKNLFCLTLSLLVSQATFLGFLHHPQPVVCITASIIMHYFFLSSFFWMNVMSFDIWRTFSGQVIMHHHHPSNQSSSKQFLKYSAYGWLSPAVVLVISISADFWLLDLFQDSQLLRSIRPMYGHNKFCWIGQGLGLFTFFVLPAVLIILLNILLFSCTTKAIIHQSRESKRMFGGGKGCVGSNNQRKSANEADVHRMKLYVKLGLIMGVCWVLGFLSGVSEWQWLWYPFVILNGLQGTFIFFAFDAKKKVFHMISERMRCKALTGKGHGQVVKGFTGTSITRRGTTTSTSLTGSRTRISSISQKTDV